MSPSPPAPKLNLIGEGLKENDVALGEVGQVSDEPAREVGELALGAGRAERVEVGLVDDHWRP